MLTPFCCADVAVWLVGDTQTDSGVQQASSTGSMSCDILNEKDTLIGRNHESTRFTFI